MAQCYVEQELQASNGGVQGDGRGARVHQVQLIAAQVLGRGGVWGTPQILCKSADCSDIGLLRLGREFAHVHVLQHALTQWRYRVIGRFHGCAPV